MEMYTVLSIWLESWSHTIKGMTEENSQKNTNADIMWAESRELIA